MRNYLSSLFVFTFLLTAASLPADELYPPVPAQLPLSNDSFAHWTNLSASGGIADFTGTTTYRFPDGPKGHFRRGLIEENDGTCDFRPWFALRFEIKLDSTHSFLSWLGLASTPVGDPANLAIKLSLPPQPERHNLPDATTAHFQVSGEGWQTITVPITSFDYNRGQVFLLKYIKEMTLTGKQANGADLHAQLRNIRLVSGDVLHLQADIKSKPGEANETVSYPVTITNCADTPQHVELKFSRHGWENMPATVTPTEITLPPGQSQQVTVSVTVPALTPPGAQETQTLVATCAGNRAHPDQLDFITLRRLPFPYLVHDVAGWQDVRDKIKKYPWAQEDFAHILKEADKFVVPEPGIDSDQGTRAVYHSYIEGKLEPVALAWKLTGKKDYAEKVALFLRRFSNPQNGYPVTLHAVSQGIPQEGGFFEGCAWAYDEIQDADVLSAADKAQIENSFRLYIETVEDGRGDGGISNWSVFNLCPAAECALAIQDMDHFNQLMYSPTGIVDQLRYGVMDDGWWYEMSLAYNLGCAGAFTHLGLAAQPFGINFLYEKYPVSDTQRVGLRLFEDDKFEGMAFGKYGPIRHNTVTIKQMFDGIAAYPDYRSVMFGMGDGHESPVGGGVFELAYYAFRDPAYAGIIARGGHRDLVYGVPDLPADPPKLYTQSVKSDDAGLALLRSQTPGREAKDQIAASLKYGTHGGYHGHFDRLALNSLMRYGRSFYNPETSWFGYGSYMYKWWVQTSLSHNMVVVDGKMQEPSECTPLLFHSGPMLQVSAVETTTRWSNPPYFGGYDQIKKVQSGDAPYVPIPEHHPKVTEVTDFSEPVQQRRILLVTDDYVLLVDDLHAQQEHQFDNLMHLRGAELVTPAVTQKHVAQFDTNPLGSGQFITDCTDYTVGADPLIHSIHRYAERRQPKDDDDAEKLRNETRDDPRHWESGGAESKSEPGLLQIDEHVLWPTQPELIIGKYAESWNVDKKLSYNVFGDEKKLASGTFGAWILGQGQVDVYVTGIKTLKLQVNVHAKADTLKTAFWGNPVIVTAEGKEIPLDSLNLQATNVLTPPTKNKDYQGGDVVIAGQPYAQAIGTEPQDLDKPATLTVDLSGLNAVRFRATLGGDWPMGQEEQLRKVVSVRSHGTDAHFVTLLEPYENASVVQSATALDATHYRIALKDGREQDIEIKSSPLSVTLTESRNGQVIRSETAQN